MPSENKKQMTKPSIGIEHTSESIKCQTEDNALRDLVIGLRTVLDQTGTYIFTKDTAGRYTYVNQMVQELFCETAEQIIGKDDSHFFNLELANELLLNDRLVLDQGKTIEREEQNIVKSTGETRFYWSVKKPLLNELGQIIGMCGISTDITERKMMENALRKSENHLRLSQMVGGIGSWEIDLSSSYDRTLDDFLDIVHPEDRKYVVDTLQSHIEHNTKYDLEYRIQSHLGERWIHSVGEAERNSEGCPVLMRGIAQDINDRKLSKTHLEQSLSLLQATLESTYDAILVVDLNNKWVLHNRRFLELWHIPDRIIVANDDSAALSFVLNQLEDADAFLAKVLELYSQPETSSFDVVKFKNGKIIERSSVPQQINDTIVGRVWSFRDVTEQELAKQALNIELEKNRALLHNGSDGIHILDQEGNVIEASDSFCDMLGYSRDEVIGMNVAQWDAGFPDKENMLAILRHQFERQERVQFETLHRRKDGSFFDVEVSGLALTLNGEPALFNSSRDITKRKQAERVVRESHQHLDTLLNSMAEGAYGVDINGICTFVNRSFLQILGYDSPEDVIGKQIHELIHHSYPDGSHYPTEDCRMYAACRHNEEVHVTNEVFWHKSGVAVQVEYWAQAIRNENNTVGGIITFVDIGERLKTENALKESEQHLRAIIETEPECVKIVDSRARLVEMNAAGLAMLEVDSLEEAQQHTLLDYVAPEDRAAFLELHRQVMSGKSGLLEFKIKGLKGTSRYLETHATPMRDINGNITSLLGITRDITESKKAEQQLRIAATAFETQEGMMVTDCKGDILTVNHAFTAITGYSAEDVIGKNPRLLSSGRHDKDFFAKMWADINSIGSWEGEIWNRRKNGEIYPEHITITAVKDEDGAVINYVATLTDITISKASAEKIERLAFYDPLTDLPNRQLLLDRLKHALAASARSRRHNALLFLDLDHFKNLNDTLGHDTGDILLQQVAKSLKACVREGDTVARFGGDEFVILLEDLSEQMFESAAQAESICEKILYSLNQPYQLGKHRYHTTSSIGITLLSGHTLEIDELLKQADIAMYQAKKHGRNTFCFFNPEMQERINRRTALEADLREALNKQQLHLYYQVQVRSSGEVLGAEALIRWIHPKRGMVSPDQFIPLAEDSGLIIPIGEWVLQTACAQLAQWQRNTFTRNFSLSVNVSAKQFHQADFDTQVQNTVLKYEIDPRLLKLELTETLLLQNIEDTIKTMTALKDIGIQFSLDDFGTGYSSLQYLKQLPLDQIKIDQSFVRDIVANLNDEAIVRTIIAMAQSLDLSCIAEGVETEEQKQLLLDNGCSHYQGYLFGRPMPINEFELLLK